MKNEEEVSFLNLREVVKVRLSWRKVTFQVACVDSAWAGDKHGIHVFFVGSSEVRAIHTICLIFHVRPHGTQV